MVYFAAAAKTAVAGAVTAKLFEGNPSVHHPNAQLFQAAAHPILHFWHRAHHPTWQISDGAGGHRRW